MNISIVDSELSVFPQRYPVTDEDRDRFSQTFEKEMNESQTPKDQSQAPLDALENEEDDNDRVYDFMIVPPFLRLDDPANQPKTVLPSIHIQTEATKGATSHPPLSEESTREAPIEPLYSERLDVVNTDNGVTAHVEVDHQVNTDNGVTAHVEVNSQVNTDNGVTAHVEVDHQVNTDNGGTAHVEVGSQVNADNGVSAHVEVDSQVDKHLPRSDVIETDSQAVTDTRDGQPNQKVINTLTHTVLEREIMSQESDSDAVIRNEVLVENTDGQTFLTDINQEKVDNSAFISREFDQYDSQLKTMNDEIESMKDRPITLERTFSPTILTNAAVDETVIQQPVTLTESVDVIGELIMESTTNEHGGKMIQTRLTLTPETLGQITIELTHTKEGVSGRLVFETDKAKEWVEHQLQQVKLPVSSNMGLLDRIEFQVATVDNQMSEHFSGQSDQSKRQHHNDTPQPSIRLNDSNEDIEVSDAPIQGYRLNYYA